MYHRTLETAWGRLVSRDVKIPLQLLSPSQLQRNAFIAGVLLGENEWDDPSTQTLKLASQCIIGSKNKKVIGVTKGLLFIENLLTSDQQLTQQDICDLHTIVNPTKRPGQFRILDARPIDRRGFKYLEPNYIEYRLQVLLSFCNERFSSSPLCLVALFLSEILWIHPFSDGNGRVSRLLVAFLLMKHQFPLNSLYNEENPDLFLDSIRCRDGNLDALNPPTQLYHYILWCFAKDPIHKPLITFSNETELDMCAIENLYTN